MLNHKCVVKMGIHFNKQTLIIQSLGIQESQEEPEHKDECIRTDKYYSMDQDLKYTEASGRNEDTHSESNINKAT